MAFDTIIKGGRVIDGSGLPVRTADVGIKGGMITDIGRLSGAKREINADGLVVIPGIIDAHTHYDPQLSFEPFGTSSCFHGVTSVVAGNCGYSIAPCAKQDHDWLSALFAKVEGMTPSVLREGLPWDWDSFPSFLETLDKRLGINLAVYIGHSAIRRYVMAEAASERAATADEIEHMKRLVREAMAAGAAGFSSSNGPTHVDQFKRPVPSRHGTFDEVLALAEAAGEGGAGSIAYLPESAPQGVDAHDRERLIQLAHRSGLPVVIQGMGYRPGNRPLWDDQTKFLAEARDKGAAIYSMLRTQPFMRPFNWRRGTSLFEGVFHWRDLPDQTPEQRLAALRDPTLREKLRWGIDNPNKDPSKGSTLPMPAMTAIFVDRSQSNPKAEGKSLAQLATERGVHPADLMCDLSVADNLETQFMWNSEAPPWIEANAEAQRNMHMIIGTGDGGAHADRDDGAEWSTYFIRTWLLERKQFSLEDGIRRITHIPAMITGLKGRGLLARGYHADITMFDPARIGLGKKTLVRDMPGGEERWQVGCEGVVRVLVNGEVIVENNKLTGTRAGRILRVGNPTN
ncbi:MAG TPA: amidohydrolase family protein [Candidatus Margulisiibacteriota bacterium]|nr:amidohydrolase family protein [Candidatus Margulisiibacteriota bacterium]